MLGLPLVIFLTTSATYSSFSPLLFHETYSNVDETYPQICPRRDFEANMTFSIKTGLRPVRDRLCGAGNVRAGGRRLAPPTLTSRHSPKRTEHDPRCITHTLPQGQAIDRPVELDRVSPRATRVPRARILPNNTRVDVLHTP